MDIWTRLGKLQTKINGELRTVGSQFYVRIDDYSYKTGAFEYRLGRRDSLLGEEKEKAKATEVVLKHFGIWKKKNVFPD